MTNAHPRPPVTLSDAYALVLENISNALLITDAKGLVEWVNPGFTRLTGYTPDDVRGKSPGRLLQGPETDPATVDFMHRKLQAGVGFRVDIVNYDKAGHPYWLALDVQPVKDAGGAVTHFVALESDVTVQAESVRLALEGARQATWDWDLVGGDFRVNGRFLAFFGYADDDVRDVPGNLFPLVHAEDLPRVQRWYERVRQGLLADDLEYRIRTANGGWAWVATRGRAVKTSQAEVAVRVCGVHADISAGKAAEEEVRRLAFHDPLTGLYNRSHLIETLQKLLNDGESVAVLFVDLDRFKQVNDTAGHSVGDRVLVDAAGRLQRVLRGGDVLARHGGDEFVVLLRGGTPETALAAGQRLLDAIVLRPFEVGAHRYHVGASIGIAHAPSHGDHASLLLARADLAMYQAKDTGRQRVQLFEHSFERQAVQTARIEEKLRRALESGGVHARFQPIVRGGTEAVVAVEALARWRDDELGDVPPTTFVPVAERTGLITALGELVMRDACSRARDWTGPEGPLLVHVNVSPLQFEDREFVARVRRVLERTGLPAARLCVEITEGVLMYDVERAARQLEQLKALGVRVAIDDFGTGWSSLTYLWKLPIDKLKIDRSFVNDLEMSKGALAMVDSILYIARRIGLSVTAEGVETAEQARTLRKLGCPELQGYHYARPLTPKEFEAWLEQANEANGQPFEADEPAGAALPA